MASVVVVNTPAGPAAVTFTPATPAASSASFRPLAFTSTNTLPASVPDRKNPNAVRWLSSALPITATGRLRTTPSAVVPWS